MTDLPHVSTLVVERAGPSTVRIGRGWGRGGGLVVGDGLVLTNAHNLRDQTTTVTFADGRVTQGAVKGLDRDGDLAVLTVDTAGASPVTWAHDQGGEQGATSDAPSAGAPVFAVALPAGGGVRVTFGTVSATGRSFRGPQGRLITDGLEHTAPVGRGSSGGPLLDTEGRLVGVNVHRLGDGFYLALPADAALRARVDALARGESPTRLRLGISIAPPVAARRLRAAVGLPEQDGLLVRGVEGDSAASRAGIKRGDLIVDAGGHPVTSADRLFEVLESLGDSSSLALRIFRGAEEIQVNVTFGSDPGVADEPADGPVSG